RDIAEVVEPSVVHISTESWVRNRLGERARRASSGSGWIYDEAGHIVTNYHVIEDAQRIEVQLYNGAIREAEIVGSDPTTDIAVLRIPSENIHPATRNSGEDGPVRQGDMVFAFGSPFDFRFSMSSGVVSGKGRSVGVIRSNRSGDIGYENFIQVDAAINPGNSGGPLTDYRGHVIGMNTAIATGRRNDRMDDGQFAGIGLAIPIEMIEPVVDQLIDTGVVAKGFLGVSVVDPSNTLIQELRLIGYDPRSPGLLVGSIDINSPARAAGLRHGDVIQYLQGKRVATMSDLERAIAEIPGTSATLRAWRYDDSAGRGAVVNVDLSPAEVRALPGMDLLSLDKEIGESFELIGFKQRGVRIASFLEDGPAGASGLRRGDIIRTVNGQSVATVQQLRSVISSMLPGQDVSLSIWRFDPASPIAEETTVTLTLDKPDTLTTGGALPSNQSLDNIRRIGIETMQTNNPTVAERLNVEFHRGVMVLELVPGSQVEKDGLLMRGSTIVAVAERPVQDVQSFVALLQAGDLRRNAGVRVTVVNPDGTTAIIRLTLDE
ncbi:MAG: trypsin-like peptidase domain-containing protein, partial [Planctomycetota bacterium]